MRGGLSYVVLMVLNPIIILFYQNCSVIPASRAEAKAAKPAVVMAIPAPESAKVSACGIGGSPNCEPTH